MEELTALRDDIKQKVEVGEGEGYKRKPDVIKWLEDVHKLENEWETMQESIAAATMLVYKCCPKCSLRSEVSTQAKNIRDQFCKLKEVGENFGSNLVVENYRVKKVEFIPGPSIQGQLTATRNLNKLLRLLEDVKDNVGSLLESAMGHYSCQRLDRVVFPYKSDIPRSICNPTLSRWGSPQSECAARVVVSDSVTPHGSRPA
ncbi:hypothetical protein CQW23_18632 [Capsicum baccatum]|uniref:Uncharacterized protein n=1 Tax=Capsicum baccatum TaxID=33114 RepID=A0A2G2W3I5_CAPBA|nr:hypothetical protein CQW23_18632 [Capsicum baccatum]